jgi:hypothetical protein
MTVELMADLTVDQMVEMMALKLAESMVDLTVD